MEGLKMATETASPNYSFVFFPHAEAECLFRAGGAGKPVHRQQFRLKATVAVDQRLERFAQIV